MQRITTVALASALLFAVPQAVLAQQGAGGATSTNIDPALAKEAKISADSARTIATQRVPRGEVASEELEREHGRLIYSFDMKVPGKAGVQEVNVSAMNGKVIGVHHETPAAERKEGRAEGAEAQRDSSKRSPP